ncbi:uncharacterized protein [Montipora capricornis]|uniref:uncharacterized protein n=1 Tax=Montipora capricornis TaxID=246305 RepID=UPI0035F10166
MTNLIYLNNNRLIQCHSGTRAFHDNREIFTFFLAITYSSAPPNVPENHIFPRNGQTFGYFTEMKFTVVLCVLLVAGIVSGGPAAVEKLKDPDMKLFPQLRVKRSYEANNNFCCKLKLDYCC